MVAYGVSMGGEVLLEAAARDTRLRAVVSDGSARPEDADKTLPPHGMERVVRGVMAPPLAGAPRPPRRALAHAVDVADRAAPRPARREQRRPGRDPDEPRLPPGRRPDHRAVGAPRCGARRRRPSPSGGLRGAHDRLPRPRAQRAAALAHAPLAAGPERLSQ